MGFLHKRDGVPLREDTGNAFIVNPASDLEWGALLEFLATEEWPEGGRRQTGTVLVFVDEGRLKACLSDRAQGLVSFVTGSSILGLLRAAEEGLRADALDWRKSRAGQRRSKG